MATAVAIETVRCVTCDADLTEIEHQPCIRCGDPVGDCCAVKEFRGGTLLDFDAAGNPVVTPRTVHYLCPACAADIESEAAELALWRAHDVQARYDELVDAEIASSEPQQPSDEARVTDEGTGVAIWPGTYCGRPVQLAPVEIKRVHAQLGAWLKGGVSLHASINGASLGAAKMTIHNGQIYEARQLGRQLVDRASEADPEGGQKETATVAPVTVSAG